MVTGCPSAIHVAHKDGDKGKGVEVRDGGPPNILCNILSRDLISQSYVFPGWPRYLRENEAATWRIRAIRRLRERESLKKDSTVTPEPHRKKVREKKSVRTAVVETELHFCDRALWTARRISEEPKCIQINCVTASACSSWRWRREGRWGSGFHSWDGPFKDLIYAFEDRPSESVCCTCTSLNPSLSLLGFLNISLTSPTPTLRSRPSLPPVFNSWSTLFTVKQLSLQRQLMSNPQWFGRTAHAAELKAIQIRWWLIWLSCMDSNVNSTQGCSA